MYEKKLSALKDHKYMFIINSRNQCESMVRGKKEKEHK